MQQYTRAPARRLSSCYKSLVQAVEGSLEEALSSVDRSEVAALAVSGQQHGLVALDASGHVLRPAKLWCDVEATQQAEALSGEFGFHLPPAFTAAKLKWLQEAEPAVYERLRHVLLPHDYVNYWLTGELAMEARTLQQAFCSTSCMVQRFDDALAARLSRQAAGPVPHASRRRVMS